MSVEFEGIAFSVLGDVHLGFGAVSKDSASNEARIAKGSSIFEAVAHGGGLLIGNLESPITRKDQGRPYKWASLRTSPDVAWRLKGLGIASLANNHIGDFGDEAVWETSRMLQKLGILSAGFGSTLREAAKPVFINLENLNLRLAVVTLCCPTTNGENFATHSTAGVAPLGIQVLRESMEAARKEADHILVYLHWGPEWVHFPVPSQMRIARRAIELGADVVAGCHSHTVMPCEKYLGKWIFYGLGNYIFSGSGAWSYGPDGPKLRALNLGSANRESIVPVFGVRSREGRREVFLHQLRATRFGEDGMPRAIHVSKLTVDFQEMNRILARNVRRFQSDLIGDFECAYEARLRDGILAYWYREANVGVSRRETLLCVIRDLIPGRVLRWIRWVRIQLLKHGRR